MRGELNLNCCGVVANVEVGSIADELDIKPKDKILEINGMKVCDIIDLSFALADEYIEILVEKENGDQEILEVEKDYDEELGIEFEEAVFDGIRRCANKCLFCFVDQMPPGMRESLYVKDDDYRLSFLYGNFITLTNLGPKDFQRIYNLHLSPLYISVHATDTKVRKLLVGNKNAGTILKYLKELTEHGIEVHTQIVLCPGLNDGVILEKTLADLYALVPGILSVAVVPVGVTAYRDNLYNLSTFSKQQACNVIEQVKVWQEKARAEFGKTFVYLADEFYIMADYPIPPSEHYDGFPQLENGIGLVRSFLDDWDKCNVEPYRYDKAKHINIISSISSEKVLKPLIDKINIPNLHIRLLPVVNHFFGPKITVTGLLTGRDILQTLRKEADPNAEVIIPGITLRKGEGIFLDGLKPSDLENALNITLKIANDACELKQYIYR